MKFILAILLNFSFNIYFFFKFFIHYFNPLNFLICSNCKKRKGWRKGRVNRRMNSGSLLFLIEDNDIFPYNQ